MRMLAAKEELGLPGSLPDPVARLSDPDGLLPLRGEGSSSVGVVIRSNYDEGGDEAWDHLERMLRERFSVAAVARITPSARPRIDGADFDTLICAVFVRHIAGSDEGGVLPTREKAILTELLARSRAAFILSFVTPYPVADLSDRWGSLCAYSESTDSAEVAVRVLAGELPARGNRFPISAAPGSETAGHDTTRKSGVQKTMPFSRATPRLQGPSRHVSML